MAYFYDEMEDAFGKKIGKLSIVVVALIGIYTVAALFFGMWPFSVARDLAHKVVNAESIVYNYEWFHDQYNSIMAQKANIDFMPKDAPERPGMMMVLNNAIAEYNAKSAEITRNMWKDDSLPHTINLDTFLKEGN